MLGGGGGCVRLELLTLSKTFSNLWPFLNCEPVDWRLKETHKAKGIILCVISKNTVCLIDSIGGCDLGLRLRQDLFLHLSSLNLDLEAVFGKVKQEE